MSDFVSAEIGIPQLHARYVDAVWRRDFKAFADCFAEDAEWRIAGLILRTRKEIDETMRLMMSHGPPPVYLTLRGVRGCQRSR
jgi:ketosteroid isomerase-like protein